MKPLTLKAFSLSERKLPIHLMRMQWKQNIGSKKTLMPNAIEDLSNIEIDSPVLTIGF